MWEQGRKPTGFLMLTGPTIILTLKVLVVAVTVLLVASLVALALGKPRWHGRINTAFFTLTMLTVVAFEGLLQFINVRATFSEAELRALRIHLWFAIPSALLLPVMLYTGLTRRRRIHTKIAVLFLLAWTGTFVTGVFFLPAG